MCPQVALWGWGQNAERIMAPQTLSVVLKDTLGKF